MTNSEYQNEGRPYQHSEYSNALYETDKGEHSTFLPKIYDILCKCLNEKDNEFDLDQAAKRLSYELE